MSEKSITNKIIKYLRDTGWWVAKIHGGPYQQAGLPDLFAFKGPYHTPTALAIEVKTPTGKVTPIQYTTLMALINHGVRAIVAQSVEDVKTYINDKIERIK